MKSGVKLPARNVILIAEWRSTKPIGPFEAAIQRLGSSFRLNHATWLVRANTTLGAIRNDLIMHLGASDTLLVVDVGEGRNVSCQLGPEIEAKLRAIWADAETGVARPTGTRSAP